jgi:hypothetical protein
MHNSSKVRESRTRGRRLNLAGFLRTTAGPVRKNLAVARKLGAFSMAQPSPEAVTRITGFAVVVDDNGFGRLLMPVLMIALLALAAFAVIGGMLTAAVVLENKQANPHPPAAKG